jgi:hypothetical protein
MKARIAPTEPKPGPVPLCDRCARVSGEYRWVSGSRSTRDFYPEFRLCRGCIQAFRNMMNAHGLKLAQKARALAEKAAKP